MSDLTRMDRDLLENLPMVFHGVKVPAFVLKLVLQRLVKCEQAVDGPVWVLTPEGALAIHPDPDCAWHKGGWCNGCEARS